MHVSTTSPLGKRWIAFTLLKPGEIAESSGSAVATGTFMPSKDTTPSKASEIIVFGAEIAQLPLGHMGDKDGACAFESLHTHDLKAAIIEEAKRRLASDQPRIPSSEVLARLKRLNEQAKQ